MVLLYFPYGIYDSYIMYDICGIYGSYGFVVMMFMTVMTWMACVMFMINMALQLCSYDNNGMYASYVVYVIVYAMPLR